MYWQRWLPNTIYNMKKECNVAYTHPPLVNTHIYLYILLYCIVHLLTLTDWCWRWLTGTVNYFLVE